MDKPLALVTAPFRGPGLERSKALAVKTAAERGRCILWSQDADRMGREVTALEEDVPGIIEPESIMSDAPDKVRRLLQLLPDNYRRILELRFLQAFSVREAANHMGVSVANAKVLQYRALRMAAQSGEEATS